MTAFPSRWPAKHPDRIQLYSLATPNGQKVSIALEELGLPYEAHLVHIGKDDQFDPDYVKISPNSKIPAIIDPNGPDGEPIAIMESAAILIYLAQKAGKLWPAHPRAQSELLQWMFFQMGHVGPMFGQFGHFYLYAKGKTDTYGENRYGKEVTRLLGVLERQVAGKPYLLGEFSLADILIVPWINGLDWYKGKDFVGYSDFTEVNAWVDRFNARPAVARGRVVCDPQ